jgi:hypothetical protein
LTISDAGAYPGRAIIRVIGMLLLEQNGEWTAGAVTGYYQTPSDLSAMILS